MQQEMLFWIIKNNIVYQCVNNEKFYILEKREWLQKKHKTYLHFLSFLDTEIAQVDHVSSDKRQWRVCVIHSR